MGSEHLRLGQRRGGWGHGQAAGTVRFGNRCPALLFSSLAEFVLPVSKACKQARWVTEDQPWELIRELIRTLLQLSQKAHLPWVCGRGLSSSSSSVSLPYQSSSAWYPWNPAASVNWTMETVWLGEESPWSVEQRFGFCSQLGTLGQVRPPLSGLSISCRGIDILPLWTPDAVITQSLKRLHHPLTAWSSLAFFWQQKGILSLPSAPQCMCVHDPRSW